MWTSHVTGEQPGDVRQSDAINEAQQLLTKVERECKKVGLGLSGAKTISSAYNVEDLVPLQTLDGTELEWMDAFKYLGSWVDSSAKDIAVRKALAWKALNGMTCIIMDIQYEN